MEFAGKIALVTGAAQGIGATVASVLLQQGAAVGLLDHQAEALQAQAKALAIQVPAGRVLPLPADITQTAAVDAAAGRLEREVGPIDILVNVAGILHVGAVQATSDVDWDHVFAVNAGGVFRTSRAVAARMVARKRGVIITVGSNAAAVPRIGMAAYAASKAAAMHFTRCLGLELAASGIRCNNVSPGATDTDMQRQLGSAPEAVLRGTPQQYRVGIPLGRIATPQDIAQAVCFLASERASHITMHDLRVDGGATLAA